MSEPARRRATYQDVLDAPPHLRAEILDGELRLSPRPARRHAIAASVIGMDIGSAFQRGRGGPGGWVILVEPEVHFGADVLIPDLAGWRKERFPISVEDDAFFSVAPDWVCEVLSPSSCSGCGCTAKFDRKDKLPIYAREAVQFAWLVDPSERTLESYRLEGNLCLLAGTYRDDDVARVAPFDAIEFGLGALWDVT